MAVPAAPGPGDHPALPAVRARLAAHLAALGEPDAEVSEARAEELAGALMDAIDGLGPGVERASLDGAEDAAEGLLAGRSGERARAAAERALAAVDRLRDAVEPEAALAATARRLALFRRDAMRHVAGAYRRGAGAGARAVREAGDVGAGRGVERAAALSADASRRCGLPAPTLEVPD